MPKGTITTFYSYKGGVGRTQALANIAVLLSRWRYRVLCVDWDLEAPGLHLYFEDWLSEPPRSGLVDLVHAHLRGRTPRYETFLTQARKGELQLDLLLAGAQNGEYVARMQNIEWDELYQEHGFGEFLETLRSDWAAYYDFVLVDSRTGITDSGGICTIHLPDNLVLLTTSNKQSLEGVFDVATRAQARRGALPFDRSKLLVLPVLTRFDKRVEFSLSEEWMTKFRNRVAPFYDEWINKDTPAKELVHFTKIPYIARWSYGESLPVYEEGSRDPESIGYAFETLAAMLANSFANTDLLIENRDSYVARARRLAATSKIAPGGERFQYDIFFSYSQQDRDFVRTLASILRDKGFRTAEDISSEPDAMEKALSASRHLVFVAGQELSRAQHIEAKVFLDATFDHSSALSNVSEVEEEKRLIVPIIRTGGTSDHLPAFMRSIQCLEEAQHTPDELARGIERSLQRERVLRQPTDMLKAPMPQVSFDVFLSYDWRDHADVEALAQRLREHGLKVFFDRWYLTPGQSWPKTLDASLADCRAVAICIGPRETGLWQQREQHLALDRQRAAERRGHTFPIIPVLLPGAEPPLGFLGQNTWVDFRARVNDPIMLNRLVNTIHGQPPGPDTQEMIRQTLATICPYRGLLYFREEDAPFFFGREAAITQLVSAVQQHSLVAVVGASGSGKSSVVRAGLVPELRKSHDRVWEVATLVPTDRPIHAMAAALMPFLEPDIDETDRLIKTNKLAEGLLGRTIALRDLVDRVLAEQPGADHLFMLADQWEELFTLCQDDAARRCFIDNILEATATTKLCVVLTLRGDFFGRAITDYRPLSDRVQGAQVNLGPMKREELRLAIEEPAKKVGLMFEAGLVDLILVQASDEPGHLPLLEFVLQRLWEARRGGELHHEAYRAMGLLEGAIAAKADSIFDRLNYQDQRRVRQIFLRLVRPGEGEADTRRRATSRELGEEAKSLINVLVDERLVVTSRLAGSVEDTVEISHEALVHHWSKLKGWVDDNREFLLWQQRLNGRRKEWEADHRRADLLLRRQALREAEAWLTKRAEDFAPDERLFVTVALNRRKRIRVALATLAGFALMVTGMTIWLWGYSLGQSMLKVQSLFSSIHLEPDMRPIAAGSFQQGDTQGGGQSDEKPVHTVVVKAFAMGQFEVTFDEYDRFALRTGRLLPGDQGWGRGRRPVINVSWQDAKDYAAWLSQNTGKRYRLPTESEWEYAARSEGKDDLWAGTSDKEELRLYAVYGGYSGTALVGHDQVRRPNAIGLYDMSGNVLEWVEDCLHDNYNQAPADGTAWLEAGRGDCQDRVNRGGAWAANRPETLRVSRRFGNLAGTRSDGLGFRLAQDLE